MAYGGYYPQNYYPQFYGNQPMPQAQQAAQNQPQVAPNTMQNQNNGVIWVLGEAAAKSFPVNIGQTVVLMDREEPVMYMKSVDQSGMPLPLRIFDITERTSEKPNVNVVKNPATDDFVSRKEFEEFRDSIRRSIKGFRKPQPEKDGDN